MLLYLFLQDHLAGFSMQLLNHTHVSLPRPDSLAYRPRSATERLHRKIAVVSRQKLQ